MLGFALLTAVDTYTYRVRLRDALDRAVVPARHRERAAPHLARPRSTSRRSCSPPTRRTSRSPGTQWPDDDGYWTGNGSLPRAAQHGALSISLYAPTFANPGPPLTAFRYLDYTHAYFPQERFDEVVQQNGWTFGRKGNGYVALWSWRPMQWRTYTDPGIFTHGLTQPFDLVAPGGADDVWFTQVGDATTVRRLRRASAPRSLGGAISVQPRAAVNGLPGGFDVSYASPDRGPRAVRHHRRPHREGPGRAARHRQALRQPVGARPVRLAAAHDRRQGRRPAARLRRPPTRTATSTPVHCGNGPRAPRPRPPRQGSRARLRSRPDAPTRSSGATTR